MISSSKRAKFALEFDKRTLFLQVNNDNSNLRYQKDFTFIFKASCLTLILLLLIVSS